jgi:vacuolar-type H+-ATPase subunit F/Vma7
MESESTKKIKLQAGNTYFLICYALVCGGKSTFYEQIISQTSAEENKDKYNIKMVSSDQIRANLSKEMQEKNKDMTFKQCFDKVGKDTAREFDKQIQAAINSYNRNKINIILVDKNYPQGIGAFMKKFCKHRNTQFFIVFIPNISKPINISDLKFPYSLNYFIQCYLRLKNRHGHEVLNGEDEESKLVYISFFKLFQNLDFQKIKGHDDKKNEKENDENDENKSTARKKERSRERDYEKKKGRFSFDDNVFLQKIDFTDESKDIEVDEETEKFFKNVIEKMKAFDMNDLKNNFQKDIDSFFKMLDEKYDGKNAFADTREKIKDEVTDLLTNGYDEK